MDRLGGAPWSRVAPGIGADLKGDGLEFTALPRVPMALSFYDGDDELEAEARVFFDMGIDRYLDMECIAVLGRLLTGLLIFGGLESL